jgi:hypothetical protein
VLASYVGLSRLHRNHYLSDVAFGAGLGIAAGLAVNQPSRRAVISPMLAPGIAGVTIDVPIFGGSWSSVVQESGRGPFKIGRSR